jgi:hypothetical protein
MDLVVFKSLATHNWLFSINEKINVDLAYKKFTFFRLIHKEIDIKKMGVIFCQRLSFFMKGSTYPFFTV